MHGRLKVLTPKDEEEKKAAERKIKLKMFETARDRIYAKRRQKDYDDEALDLTAKLLLKNPDVLSFWNYRREIVEVLSQPGVDTSASGVTINDVFYMHELQLTEACIQENPKSYSAWHHRGWILKRMANPAFDQELEQCNQALQMDERNFHCWDHRRIVCGLADVTSEKELAFSDEKIRENFSNYSAWHYRSSLLPKLFPSDDAKLPLEEDRLKAEFELVQNAFFTDPEDSSAWFYHYWLLQRPDNGSESNLRIEKMTVDVANHRIAVVLNQTCVITDYDPKVCLSKDGSGQNHAEIELMSVWKTTDGSRSSSYWVCSFSKLSVTSDDDASPSSPEFPSREFSKLASDSLSPLEGNSKYTVYLHISGCKLVSMSAVLKPHEKFTSTVVPCGFDTLPKGVVTLLREELASCQTLLEMEPDNKWPLLNMVVTMQAVDPIEYEAKIGEYLEKLQSVDAKRKFHYIDMVEKFRISNRLATAKTGASFLDLSKLKLTKLQLTFGLINVLELDISNNSVTSIAPLKYLCNMRKLNADNNQISSLIPLKDILNLRSISVCNNVISDVAEVKPLRILRLQTFKAEGNILHTAVIYAELGLAPPLKPLYV